ncbi:MAG: hypothetical protein ACE5LF_02570 [Alphaproteobacteria bacterium]
MRHQLTERETPKTAVIRVVGATMLALALLLGVRAQASAQTVCAPHAEVTKRLDKVYSEAPIGIGLASNGGVIEMFATSDGATWTIVMTMPDGKSCVMATGETWETLPGKPLGPMA